SGPRPANARAIFSSRSTSVLRLNLSPQLGDAPGQLLVLAGLDRRPDQLDVDLARGQDRAGGGRRLARAGPGGGHDPRQPVDQGAAEGPGDRPSFTQGARHKPDVPDAAPAPTPQTPRAIGGAHGLSPLAPTVRPARMILRPRRPARIAGATARPG